MMLLLEYLVPGLLGFLIAALFLVGHIALFEAIKADKSAKYRCSTCGQPADPDDVKERIDACLDKIQ